jgi:rhodanese-related sulfurtransferase
MKRSLVVLFALVLMAAMAITATAGKVPTPTEAPQGVTIISAADAQPLIQQNQVKAFDMRKALNYGKGHLPSATSLPYKWTKKGHRSERKGVKILFHSDGPNGWKSYYASKAAVEAGYKNVMWMREGFATWKEKGYPIDH